MLKELSKSEEIAPSRLSRENSLELTPREIVRELDRFIIGQAAAKRSVAIALRNRWRRKQVPEDLRDEITPKNIIMIGPTGVGKTEIARRLARLAGAPFLKIEASKFTEVGYVGKDVESMVRDLVEISIGLVREEEMNSMQGRVRQHVEERILDLLYPPKSAAEASEGTSEEDRTREKLRQLFRNGGLDDKKIEVNVTERSPFQHFEVFSPQGLEEVSMNIREMFGNMAPKSSKSKKMTVAEAKEALKQEECSKLLDMDKIKKMALERAEQSGIIFLDEIDKVAGKGSQQGPDISREGVQRDILPIVEGTTVNTKYGMVRTDHVLFIAAGAFHVSKPSDLIPELQGRFPIRVELDSLTDEDLYRILTEPENSLPRQYRALLSTEGVDIEFSENALRRIVGIAREVNSETENIGARRLHTVMEKLLEDISFEAPETHGDFQVDETFVNKKLSSLLENKDLTRYIL